MDHHAGGQGTKNRLATETSPYLLQHAENPVDWFPWGGEALSKAKSEDKPIFLSVGYSACHWCHVMAHESFEDQEIAKIMNENFVNIKVDREERPDIDDIYQRVCQLATGTGGWPLSVFLSPDQKPFYVGTYFPKEGGRYGMSGFANILLQLSHAYKNKRSEISAASLEFMNAIVSTAKDISSRPAEMSQIQRSVLDEAAVGLLQMGDNIYGGFGQAPKFPNPSNLMFLLRYFDISGLGKFRDFTVFTADRMAMGGINDQIGGGFSRYSTDQKWLVPHFEKMLYDNALLAQFYSEVFQITKESRYLGVVERTLDFILREMRHPDGGLFAALDADSEGEEGKFYVWSKKEILDELGSGNASSLFCEYFGVTDGGNFEGRNILNQRTTVSALSKSRGISEQEAHKTLSESSEKLYAARERRVRPGRDEKVLTSWNGLGISALAKGYHATGARKYLDAAEAAVRFVDDRLSSGGDRLRHSFKDGKSSQQGFLDDYAFFASGLLDLFSVSSKPGYLARAIRLTDAMLDHFWDKKDGGLFFTSDDQEKLIARTKNYYDLAVPSGNSVACMNLLRLFQYTQNKEYLDKATAIISAGVLPAAENPFGFGQLLISIYLYVKKPVEITIIPSGLDSPMRKWLGQKFLPDAVTAMPQPSDLSGLAGYSFFSGRTHAESVRSDIAFVCRNFSCSLPIHTVEGLERQLNLPS